MSGIDPRGSVQPGGHRRSRVVLLSGHHLCHNPRVIKEADTLCEAGYDVTVVGGWTDASLAARDRALMTTRSWRFVPAVDAGDGAARASWNARRHRLRTKLGKAAHRWLGLENPWQLGYAVPGMLRTAASMRASLYIAHSEQGLWVADALLHRGHRVGVDMEDWFSEDLPEPSRRGRPIALLRTLERTLLRSGVHRTCPSRAMGDALARQYDCAPPESIYNAFPLADRATIDGSRRDRRDSRLPSIHWYSQTLGMDRGLQDLLGALPHLTTPVEVHLRGTPARGFEQWMSERTPAPWRERIFVHGLVTNDELLSRIAEHDIGFAGEASHPRSRDLTVTNKIMHYLLAGLAVVASDTSGQREVAEQAPGAISLYPGGDCRKLALALNLLLGSPELLESCKAAALSAARHTFCWDRQVPRFIASIAHAMTSDPSATDCLSEPGVLQRG